MQQLRRTKHPHSKHLLLMEPLLRKRHICKQSNVPGAAGRAPPKPFSLVNCALGAPIVEPAVAQNHAYKRPRFRSSAHGKAWM